MIKKYYKLGVKKMKESNSFNVQQQGINNFNSMFK